MAPTYVSGPLTLTVVGETARTGAVPYGVSLWETLSANRRCPAPERHPHQRRRRKPARGFPGAVTNPPYGRGRTARSAHGDKTRVTRFICASTPAAVGQPKRGSLHRNPDCRAEFCSPPPDCRGGRPAAGMFSYLGSRITGQRLRRDVDDVPAPRPSGHRINNAPTIHSQATM